ncbi:MAG: hypothetical protein N2C14_17535, partial [Planctomycetales bacterium]
AAVCLGLRQNVRVLVPIAPALAVLVAWVASESRRMRPLAGLLARGTLASLLMLGVLIAGRRAARKLPVATGWESRDAYLVQHEPTHVIAQAVSRLTPSDARILSQEQRAFYFDRAVVRELIYRRKTDYHRQANVPLATQLARAGFTHLLLAESTSPEGPPYDPTLSDLVRDALRGGSACGLRTIHEEDFTDPRGTTRRYRLVRVEAVKNVSPDVVRAAKE